MRGDFYVVCGNTHATIRQKCCHAQTPPLGFPNRPEWSKAFKMSESGVKPHTRACFKKLKDGNPQICSSYSIFSYLPECLCISLFLFSPSGKKLCDRPGAVDSLGSFIVPMGKDCAFIRLCL